MQRLLLTQHQVRILASLFTTAVVVSLLFALGVHWQTQSTQRLRASIPSKPPAAPVSPDAIVLPVPDHRQLCSAVMAALDLPPDMRKIILFPSSWAEGGVGDDPFASTERRLLRKALVRGHGVEIRPVDDELLRRAPVAEAVRTDGVDTVMLLRLPGFVLHPELFRALAEARDEHISIVRGARNETDMLIVRGHEAKDAISEMLTSEHPRLPLDAVAEQPALPGVMITERRSLTASLADLRDFAEDFDFPSYAWQLRAAWATFTDPLLPLGPEIDVPFDQKLLARPKNKAADWLWTDMYGRFAERRREVCGLGLESWYE